MQCLWDSDAVSQFIRGRDPIVRRRARDYLNRYQQASLSVLTKYEVQRGWKAQRANRLLTLLDAFCQQSSILAITEAILDSAADLWADLRRAGQTIGDSDPIIAATALHHGLGVATRNVAHFRRIPGLTVEDWTQP